MQVLFIGRHRLEVVDDVVLWVAHGPCDVDDLRQVIAVGEELAARYGRYYSLIDAREGITITPAARRYSAEWERARGGSKAYTVIFGASTFLRTLVTLINRAAELILSRSPEIVFVATEAEARAHIAADRKRRAEKAAEPKAEPATEPAARTSPGK
jgi:hypothetical protein